MTNEQVIKLVNLVGDIADSSFGKGYKLATKHAQQQKKNDCRDSEMFPTDFTTIQEQSNDELIELLKRMPPAHPYRNIWDAVIQEISRRLSTQTGEWEKMQVDDHYGYDVWKCSKCDALVTRKTYHCPKCGSIMEGLK